MFAAIRSVARGSWEAVTSLAKRDDEEPSCRKAAGKREAIAAALGAFPVSSFIFALGNAADYRSARAADIPPTTALKRMLFTSTVQAVATTAAFAATRDGLLALEVGAAIGLVPFGKGLYKRWTP